MKRKQSLLLILSLVVLFAACKKGNQPETKLEEQSMHQDMSGSHKPPFIGADALSQQTIWELQQARSATAKYRNIKNALDDQYEDIKLVMPNMGFHFMKKPIVDTVIDFGKPEVLVYNKDQDGSFKLVAVEYVYPLHLSPTIPPEGFTGSSDVWDRNTDFDLWTLHAWVWQFNPDGVFNPTNPLVIVP